MKKLLAIILAAVMIAACSVTAFAETTNVSYNVDPSYTVSIPAAVTLGDSAVEADITASDVILEDGKQVVVELTSASNTASGSTFNAKNGDSTVTYTITGDEAIAVGDTVATFTANGSKTLTFSAADKSAVTVAGTHTETLTFGISVEDSFESVLAPALENGAKIKFEYKYNGRYSAYFEFTNNNGSYTLSPLDDDEFNTTNLSVKADNPNVLILDVVCAIGTSRRDSFCSTIEFDTTDNTFKFTNRGATPTNPPRKCDLISVSVNGTDVTNKLTDESTDKS